VRRITPATRYDRLISLGLAHMQHQTFRITYDGPALDANEMEIRELAPALHAMGDLLEHANRVVNGETSKVAVHVKGSFKTGSFGIDLALYQSIAADIVDFFSTKEVQAVGLVLTYLGLNARDGIAAAKYGLIQVLKWIRGRPITSVRTTESAAIIVVENEVLEIELPVLALLRDLKSRQALEALITRPLSRDGIDSFSCGSDVAIYETVDRSEAHYFLVPAEIDEEVVEARYTANVRIVRIEFNEENKWRFTDGDHTFYASILDDAFLRRIATDEVSFSRGDVLRVMVRRRQSTIGDQIKSTYFIDEVLEHRTAYRQIRLPFEDGAQVSPAGPASRH
jgi:hypothetical protein